MGITKNRREKVFDLDENRCLNCGSSCNLEIDHIVPQVAGGSDALKNLQTLCLTCNRRKADQTIDYRSPERRLRAEAECQSEWEMRLVARSFGKSLERSESIWETCGAVERHGDGLRRQWVFAGTWLPIAELFEKLNEGVTLDEFLNMYEGVERSDAEEIIDRQIERLRAARAS